MANAVTFPRHILWRNDPWFNRKLFPDSVRDSLVLVLMVFEAADLKIMVLSGNVTDRRFNEAKSCRRLRVMGFGQS